MSKSSTSRATPLHPATRCPLRSFPSRPTTTATAIPIQRCLAALRTNQWQWLVQSTVLPPATTATPPWFVQPVVFSGTLKSGSALVSGIGSTSHLVAGQIVTGTGIPSGTTILTVNSSSTITLSANATVSGSESLSASTPANVVPFQGDFDGDGLTDLAYYQPSTATWYVDDSLRGTSSFVLGTANSSIPVVGYFDANGPEEMAVFTIVNGKGVWSIASASTSTVTFGQTGDIPAPGNYDGLGYDQIAVYRPSTGQFLVLEPNGTTETLNLGVGGSADLSSLVPVPGGLRQPSLFQQQSAAADRSGCVRSRHRCVHDSGTR